ncbi:MAG TPA: BadF/BadG/BcrA/BcrD ATPase family protein, partial [Longimicrobiales bacterium]|nr:BadF/BadG/BcrA/BcrD ATPase family protein [Longimicrobiales bacterium]
MFYIGIDGGGTQTTALLTDSEGHELGRTSGPPGIIDVLDPEAGARALADLASQTLTDAGIDAQASAIVCALAGAGREPERTRLEQSLEAQRVAGTVCITTDFDAAMHDAFGGGSGILVIAGTGSSAWGRNEDGRTARAGGWGVILGDEGSGYAIGTAALRRCMREFDGRDHGDDWVPLILAQTGVSSVEQLVRWAAAAPKADIAALAPAVFEAAFRGNAVGRGIVLNAAKEICKHVVALHDRLKPWNAPPTVALTGGL